jgi:hypothetical protein
MLVGDFWADCQVYQTWSYAPLATRLTLLVFTTNQRGTIQSLVFSRITGFKHLCFAIVQIMAESKAFGVAVGSAAMTNAIVLLRSMPDQVFLMCACRGVCYDTVDQTGGIH